MKLFDLKQHMYHGHFARRAAWERGRIITVEDVANISCAEAMEQDWEAIYNTGRAANSAQRMEEKQ